MLNIDRKKLLNSVLLCAAADAGDSDEVTRLLSSGISPNVRGLRHRTALHCAASSGRLQVVELLLMNGVRKFAWTVVYCVRHRLAGSLHLSPTG